MTMGEGRLEEGRPIEPALPLAAARAIKIDGDAVTHLGRRYRIWLSPPIEGKINTGCFAADVPGRWYFRLQSEVEEHTNCGSGGRHRSRLEVACGAFDRREDPEPAALPQVRARAG